MCGIAGLLSTEPNGRELVSAMLRTQDHRGPDGDGIWSRPLGDGRTLHLGHRRLAILDLSDGAAQPMYDASGDLVLTYNGEIYNYLEVRRELAAQGVRFRTQSDTEVLLEAYRHWGTACLDRFNGMYAFALYDRRTQKIFCARDRFGEKPFLFACRGNVFAFASEYKALLLHPALSLDIDEIRLLRAAHKPSGGLDTDRQTVFNDVQQLLPGEAMEVDVRSLGTRIWRYWRIEPGPERQGEREEDVFAEFRELLIDSVRLRMRSDVPVGSCLSGGLDSSAIVCIARKLLGDDADYRTFTGRFPGTSADEWRYASQIASHTHVITHTVEPTVERFLEDLPQFIWHNELPVGSSSQFAQWCVFRLAREHGVTVLLDGQGADEMLGGYEQYFAYYVQALEERGDVQRLKSELPRIQERYPLALAGPRRVLQDRLPFRMRHWLANRLNTGTNVLYAIRPDVSEQVAQANRLERNRDLNPLANALEHDTFSGYLTTLLRYGDRNSMAHSREVRLPFCDHRLAEFAFKLAPGCVMGEVQTKRLLRESMKGILPEEIRTRWNKQGFRPPQDLWFKSPHMVRVVRDRLHGLTSPKDSVWSESWCRSALARLEQGQTQLGWMLWKPFIIAAWKEMFLDRIAAQRAAVKRLEPAQAQPA